jgi:magnesium chelatase family protein
MGPGDLDRFAPLAPTARRVLLEACERMGLSARGFDRVRRVARTLADLEGGEAIGPHHVAEAVQYRRASVLGGG